MANTNVELERVKLLYDYTKFHIGLYGTLLAGFIGILSFGLPLSSTALGALRVVILLLLIAAMSGGVVASSVIDVYQNYGVWGPEQNLKDFWSTRIGPFKLKWMKAKTWWLIEHTAFWLAVLIVVVGFLLKGIIW